MQRITPIIKQYAWGSREALGRLSGRPVPTSQPEAELWVGAHEAGPSIVESTSMTLNEFIAADLDVHLGAVNAEKFDGRLPFLLKILAAQKALSIQVHPDAARAANAPAGTYVDSWPKPEAWVPLTECEAFVGMLPFAKSAQLLCGLNVPLLTELVDDAEKADNPAHALLKAVLHVDEAVSASFVADVVAAMKAQDVESPHIAAALNVHEQFPGDIGVVVLLLMEHHVLTPGLSYFLDAGVLHSFVRGVTVEVLANSDNVVRAGLTPKKIDIEELLEIVDVNARIDGEKPAATDDGQVLRYPSKVPHFALYEVKPSPDGVRLPVDGQPALVMASGGAAALSYESADADAATASLDLAPLECAWISASDPAVKAASSDGASVFVATVNTGFLTRDNA